MIERFTHLDPLMQVFAVLFAGFCAFMLALSVVESRAERRKARKDRMIERVMEFDA